MEWWLNSLISVIGLWCAGHPECVFCKFEVEGLDIGLCLEGLGNSHDPLLQVSCSFASAPEKPIQVRFVSQTLTHNNVLETD